MEQVHSVPHSVKQGISWWRERRDRTSKARLNRPHSQNYRDNTQCALSGCGGIPTSGVKVSRSATSKKPERVAGPRWSKTQTHIKNASPKYSILLQPTDPIWELYGEMPKHAAPGSIRSQLTMTAPTASPWISSSMQMLRYAPGCRMVGEARSSAQTWCSHALYRYVTSCKRRYKHDFGPTMNYEQARHCRKTKEGARCYV